MAGTGGYGSSGAGGIVAEIGTSSSTDLSARFGRIGVVGGGAWGTALAQTAARAGRDVILWARSADTRETMLARRENTVYLPGILLDPAIAVTGDLSELGRADAVLFVVPSQHLRTLARAAHPHLRDGTPVVICAKGIEAGSGALLTDVIAAELPGHPRAVLSGPTFAAEVARGLPTAVTIAIAPPDPGDIGATLVRSLGSATFRPYLSCDPVGVEVGGAVKNVLAIACGIAEGRGIGANARAALITRGLAEVARLVAALDGRAETLMGLAGLGDLTLTCSSPQSRNMAFGLALGRGDSVAEALAGKRAVVEGIINAASIVELAHMRGVDMPICQAVHAILHRGADLDTAIRTLLDRPFRMEGREP